MSLIQQICKIILDTTPTNTEKRESLNSDSSPLRSRQINKYYKGVSISELNAVANECQRDSYVCVHGDVLIYVYKSRRGHQTNRMECVVRNGALESRTFGSYPGQTHFPDQEFLRRVNSKYQFRD